MRRERGRRLNFPPIRALFSIQLSLIHLPRQHISGNTESLFDLSLFGGITWPASLNLVRSSRWPVIPTEWGLWEGDNGWVRCPDWYSDPVRIASRLSRLCPLPRCVRLREGRERFTFLLQVGDGHVGRNGSHGVEFRKLWVPGQPYWEWRIRIFKGKQ